MSSSKLPSRESSARSHARHVAGYAGCLVIGWLFAMLLVGCSTVQVGPDGSPNPSQLTWSPPTCGDLDHACVDLRLRNTGLHQTPLLDNDTDYRIHLPANGPLMGGITIIGGRHVLIIGGQINLTFPCSNDESDCMGIYIARSSPGAVFVEGVWIHNPARIGRTCPGGASTTSQTCSSGDGIGVNTTNNGKINVNTITLQNIRVDGISGCSGYGDHGDVFQPYQAPDDKIRIDRMTGVTNCQGFMLDPDLAYSVWHRFPSSITIMNANIEVNGNPYRASTYEPITWWLTHGSCQSGPITLTNAYSSKPSGHGIPHVVWPFTSDDSCPARYSQGAFSWPGTRIEGSVRLGSPPGGDFVPPDAVGLGYRSPGYR